jgi:hypothetical protein
MLIMLIIGSFYWAISSICFAETTYPSPPPNSLRIHANKSSKDNFNYKLTGEIFDGASGSNVASAVFKPLAYEGIGAPLLNASGGTSAVGCQLTCTADPVPQKFSLIYSYPTGYYITNRACHGGEGFNRADMRSYLRTSRRFSLVWAFGTSSFPRPPTGIANLPVLKFSMCTVSVETFSIVNI